MHGQGHNAQVSCTVHNTQYKHTNLVLMVFHLRKEMKDPGNKYTHAQCTSQSTMHDVKSTCKT